MLFDSFLSLVWDGSILCRFVEAYSVTQQHLHLWFRVALGFTLFSRLTHHRMPNAISVRQISGLPRASFRSRLATDTLASGYALGATSCARDFHPLEHAHAGRTEIKALLFRGAFFMLALFRQTFDTARLDRSFAAR